MINSIEDLRSAGVLPIGPVSAWPQERNVSGPELDEATSGPKPKATKVRAGLGKMTKGLVTNAARAVTGGKVASDVREERMAVCRNCPFFIEKTKRCSECGCFMEAKTWINYDAKKLCPKQKWVR